MIRSYEVVTKSATSFFIVIYPLDITKEVCYNANAQKGTNSSRKEIEV